MRNWAVISWLLFALAVPPCMAHLSASQPPHAAPLSPEEESWLRHNQDKLVLLYNTDFPPIEFAATNGAFAGLGADVIAMIEKRLNVTFHKQASDDWNKHLAALASGACAIAPTIVRTEERERFAFFTTPYATAPVVIITPRTREGSLTLDDLAGQRVAVVSGFATEKYVLDQARGRFEVIPLWNVPEGLRAVSFGEVDAFVENLAVAAYHIEKMGLPNLRVAGSTDYAFAWSIGVSHKYPLLFSAIQKALDGIPEERIAEAQARWIALATPRRLAPETMRRILLAVLFILSLVICLAGITVLLKRRLNEKVASLRLTQEDLRKSEEMYRVLISTIPDVVVRTNLHGTILFINDVDFPLLRQYGRQAILGRNMLEFLAPEDRARAQELTRRMLETYQGIQEYRLLGPDGALTACEVNGDVLRDAQGAPFGMVYVLRDVTARKQAEAERVRLQAQLMQAQKMESVGRLAGGVAHDFNNMLGVILGHAEMARGEVPPANPLYENLQEIEKAAQRSADLTRQLLAFARKQPIAPQVLDLNETVGHTLKMLRRLIGEEIELSWVPGPGLWHVKMDPIQIDQILANLALNARDAISGAGTVSIETANAVFAESYCATHADCQPGDYVMLAISDTGRGMDKQVQAHIFEPFFTTKSHGTGLGLATIFGVVKQNNGFIHLYSEPGQGTTFKIYLPRCCEESVEPAARLPAVMPRGNGETILVIEDEAVILKTATRMLEKLGYQVLAAQTPEEAIRLAEAQAGRLALLLTDVVMPAMNGKELAAHILRICPSARCLFMSGYTADVIAHRGILDKGVRFIQKPFSAADLAIKVREALLNA